VAKAMGPTASIKLKRDAAYHGFSFGSPDISGGLGALAQFPSGIPPAASNVQAKALFAYKFHMQSAKSRLKLHIRHGRLTILQRRAIAPEAGEAGMQWSCLQSAQKDMG
jgi:hypothetical protein